MEEAANKALLDVAGKDPRVMAAIINKYCHIRVSYDHKIRNMKENIRAKIYKTAEQTVLSGRSRELDGRIKGIIDMILRPASGGGRRQYEEGTGTASGARGPKRQPEVSGRYHKTSKSGAASLTFLKLLASLADQTRHQAKKESGAGIGRKYAGGTRPADARYVPKGARKPYSSAIGSEPGGDLRPVNGTVRQHFTRDTDGAKDGEQDSDGRADV
ncbi:MAG: hypothetical protein Q8O05_04175 [Chloroflexota bacterium]|nr:hypothetical protein [Chloroflexota bacterium]